MIEWVAEIGSNHKGIPALAHEMIRQAALAGATVAKFQLGWPKDDKIRHIDSYTTKQLCQACDYYGVGFAASLWSDDALELASFLPLRFGKLAAQLSDKQHLIERLVAASEYTPIYVSGKTNTENYRGIYTQSQYPTYPESQQWGNWPFGDEYLEYYGYSSHVPGYADALIAVARGAKYIEKHVTLDKTEESIRDNHFALDFNEFAEMVRIGNQMARLV